MERKYKIQLTNNASGEELKVGNVVDFVVAGAGSIEWHYDI